MLFHQKNATSQADKNGSQVPSVNKRPGFQNAGKECWNDGVTNRFFLPEESHPEFPYKGMIQKKGKRRVRRHWIRRIDKSEEDFVKVTSLIPEGWEKGRVTDPFYMTPQKRATLNGKAQDSDITLNQIAKNLRTRGASWDEIEGIIGCKIEELL